MRMVLLTAIGVGGATIIGALIGFIFREMSHRFSDIVLSFAAGVMLSAAVLGLIIPSVEYGGDFGLLVTVAGIFTGALCLNLIDKLVPHLHKLVGTDSESHNNANLNKVLLFVTAIAIHNLPEGVAAGVGFGSGDTSQALMIAGGIALQNIPEGMVIIAPMLAAGAGRSRWRFGCPTRSGSGSSGSGRMYSGWSPRACRCGRRSRRVPRESSRCAWYFPRYKDRPYRRSGCRRVCPERPRKPGRTEQR